MQARQAVALVSHELQDRYARWGWNFSALDVVGQSYEVSGGHVTAMGAPTTLLELTTPGSALWVFTDPHDRLWVAAPQGATTTFFVLARGAMP